MNFVFSQQEQYLTRWLPSLLRYFLATRTIDHIFWPSCNILYINFSGAFFFILSWLVWNLVRAIPTCPRLELIAFISAFGLTFCLKCFKKYNRLKANKTGEKDTGNERSLSGIQSLFAIWSYRVSIFTQSSFLTFKMDFHVRTKYLMDPWSLDYWTIFWALCLNLFGGRHAGPAAEVYFFLEGGKEKWGRIKCDVV